ncbi:hypothetical protein CYMTET_30307 [Cymbomonas tetramitiformis]|uniref:Uncharacterized protein n=1 Tax=Cymbomonas tetramitiformis TaxID=36881 RepID=A0AAE0KU24_9CHLO|nr:hypothetical protein CYMTET_30307 [Cymbomonas tetramitiformis]
MALSRASMSKALFRLSPSTLTISMRVSKISYGKNRMPKLATRDYHALLHNRRSSPFLDQRKKFSLVPSCSVLTTNRCCASTSTAPLEERDQGRLILTSNGLSTEPLKRTFLELMEPKAANVIAYIPTAILAPSGTSKASPGVQRRRNRQEGKRRAKVLQEELCMPVKSIDISVVTGEELQEQLDGISAFYVDGGNTFFLHYHAVQSGFTQYARELVHTGQALYVGKSAGSIITGLTASTALWKGWDDPTVVPLDINDPKVRPRAPLEYYCWMCMRHALHDSSM